MDIFDVLSLIGGLCLFLYGMNVMGAALERLAGGKLQSLLGKLTTGKIAGLLTGLGVTAVIQSSSATTVMVVGFVNSGLMSLKQAINVIMGANIGTTVTAWIISLGGIQGDSLLLQLMKPMSFTPVLALIGIILYMFCKRDKEKEAGTILLGFAVLMFGMDIMTNSVSGLKDVPAFRELFLLFKNPILGVLAGAVLTAIIQSSSASVGILQALVVTGQVSYGAAIPIIMGQNIGTCITAILSSFGTNRNAKRTALVHLSFNVIGTAVWLTAYAVAEAVLQPALFDMAATQSGIATAHSLFNLACTVLLLPCSGLLEKLAYLLVPETAATGRITRLDERLLAMPAAALEQCRKLSVEMAALTVEAVKLALSAFTAYNSGTLDRVREMEKESDRCEDEIGAYLVKLSAGQLGDSDSAEAALLLKTIGDLERIGDHARNLAESAEEMHTKSLRFSNEAMNELDNLGAALSRILDLTYNAYSHRDPGAASGVEALEQVIDELKEACRGNHIRRLQQGSCTIETGFVWSDILTDMERSADHCANIAESVLEGANHHLATHASVRRQRRENPLYKAHYEAFAKEFQL